ncbi:hypothetical protein [Roseovarius pacificus]|uniref:hypothetical protein n=1 Tax=Roseovarius pacificus TaxID=337701 RepID=UPI002A186DEB|nr:hypothetical protein [Roseovarius pacificus]
MQILAACNGTSRERTRTARAKSVQFVPGMSCYDVKENAVTSAKVNGVNSKSTHGTAHRDNISSRPNSAMSKWAKSAHRKAAKVLGYALTLGTADAWAGFSTVAAARLPETERAALAFAALNSLDLEQAEITAAASIGSRGAPLPTFLGGMDEARTWASFANRHELKAFALAAYEAMSAQDQAAFFRHISEVEIAI